MQKLTYTYDNGGNVSNLVDTVNAGQKQCYQYDWLDRLTGAFTGDATCAAFSATGTGSYNHTYAYNTLGNITSNAGNAYTYGDAGHKHAVTAAFGNSYGHDANGNQTTRTIAGVTYTFTYDYENHLTAVSGGSVSVSFVYDADGNRVKSTVNGTTTVYIAGLYEYQGGATTLYYEGNALRRTGYATDNGVFYLLQDQLKSSSVLANQNGTINSRNYFYPFGGNRGGAAFSALTTKRFTGQYHEQGLPGGEGLSYYGARWYDAQLGRFASPDSLVPSPGNPQAFNRYSYVKNNPLGRVDPTGHYDVTPGDDPYWRNTGSSSAANRVYLPIVSSQGSYVSSRPTFWPPFLPYPYSLPTSLSKKGIASWVSQNNISTTVGLQFGFDACAGFGVGGCGSGEVQASFNWWSGELAYTLNQASAGRIGSPGASLGLHAGTTFTAGASDIGNAILGASRFTSIDGSVGTPIVDVSVVGAAIWSRSYNYQDLNHDGQFGNNGFTEPLLDPYIDPVFNRTVDALSLNGGGSAGLGAGLGGGISHGITDTNRWFIIDTYSYVKSALQPFQTVANWLWGK